MRLKLLLLFIGISSMIWAQLDTIPMDSLVITEVNETEQGGYSNVYWEITNMSTATDIDLGEIKFITRLEEGVLDVNDPITYPWIAQSDKWFTLPPSVVKVLKPGESYTLGIVYDFAWTQQQNRVPGYGNSRPNNLSVYPYLDFKAHRYEKDAIEEVRYPNVKDSLTFGPDSMFYDGQFGSFIVSTIGFAWKANQGLILQHNFAPDDSAVIDQCGHMFDDGNGKNLDVPHDVAGVTNANLEALLVRKYGIKKGNLDYANSRGVGLDDSDWMAVKYPEGYDNRRDVWWSIGNHGPYVLDENTLEKKEGSDISVDFAGKTITVPWGTRRLDDIMRNMKYKPGVAWIYKLNGIQQDSLLRSAQDGDKLIIHVFGETLHSDTFDIEVNDPLPGDNIVIPVDHKSTDGGAITSNTQDGLLGWPRVTYNGTGTDTITGGNYGMPYALRIDTLYKYLEKAPNATWDIEFADGNPRADLKTGDKLVVKAQNGTEKKYFIEIAMYEENHDAFLSSITWPDNNLSEVEKYIFEWTGDTIPKWHPNTTSYRITLPFRIQNIPALIPKTQNPNASVKVLQKAISFIGTAEHRTTTFEVTAQDDSVKKVYSVEFVRQKNPANIQPYLGEPFIGSYLLKIESSNYMEICNPWNQPLDLSKYMIARGSGTNPNDAITQNMLNDSLTWVSRYKKYIPGRKWVDHVQWLTDPGTVEADPDINVNSVIQPGDVFCLGEIRSDNLLNEMEDPLNNWNVLQNLDVQFLDYSGDYLTVNNTWGGEAAGEPSSFSPLSNTFTTNVYLFEILNDTVRSGGKPANDPLDFRLIDVLAMADGSRWVVAGVESRQRATYIRKPEITEGDSVQGSSFGTNEDDSEWFVKDWSWYNRNGLGPQSNAVKLMEGDLGQHFFNEPTHYMSTVSAVFYKVSVGYSMKETILGVITGSTVEEFLSNIFKADTGQTLTLISSVNGNALAMDDVLTSTDTLVVLSANGENTTKYVLELGAGLSDDAVLTSTVYDIPQPQGNTGTVSGMEHGILLSEAINNVTVPAGATLTVVDKDTMFIPLKRLNYGGEYVDVTVTSGMYFEVLAENKSTSIMYELMPLIANDTAFVTSEVYKVEPDQMLIRFIPYGTGIDVFTGNLTPSPGASLKILDKVGSERTSGWITEDDRLVVTSASGANTVIYFFTLVDADNIESTTNLAFIISDVYDIDQVSFIINQVPGATSVSDLISRITASPGATAVVVDANKLEKASGEILQDDMVKVTSANGGLTVYYTLGRLTGYQLLKLNQIHMYPNPTNSTLTIDGLKTGSRVQVYNAIGAIMRDSYSQSPQHIISLDGEASGLYIIVISDNDIPIGRLKAIKN